MEPVYTAWGRFGPTQYAAPTSGRVLSDHHWLAVQPFVRTPTTRKTDLLDVLRDNLWVVYESLWRMTVQRHHSSADLRVETRAGVAQRVSAWRIEDLCTSIDTQTDYWIKNYRALITHTALQWERIATLRTARHVPFVVRLTPGVPLDPALVPVYAAVWRALQFGDAATARARGHYFVLNTSNLNGTTLRDKALSWLALPEAFRERCALHNDDITAAQLAAICTKFGIRAVLDVGRAVDAVNARLTQSHPLFATIRATWEITAHASTTAPGFVVFLRDVPDRADIVDRYLLHFALNDAKIRWRAPHVVLIPTLF